MPRLPRLLFLVLLAVSGCGSLRGCGAPESDTVEAASAPEASTPSVALPPPEARYARSWLVIIHSSATPGEGTGALEALKKTGLPAEPDRLSSNAFRNLRPCLEVVVARAFVDKEGAESYRRTLSEAGLEAYVKNAGPLAPDREEKEATCRAEAQAAAARVEARAQGPVPRFVEVHDGRTFMLLGAADDPSGLSPVNGSRSVWMAPVEQDPTGFFAKGDDVDLYGAAGPVQAGCKVSGFVRINRGKPHFGYFQQQPPPEAPGCGRAWTFAELDCAMTPSDVVFALPAGTKAPVFYAAGNEAPPEVLAAQEDALRRSAGFATRLAEGRLRAEQVQEELDEDVRGFGFSSEGRHVVFMMARFTTGEGNADCGGDYNEQLTRAVVVGPGGEERLLSVKDLDGGRVAGVLDLEGDGQVELLLHDSWPSQTARVIREDGSEVAGAVVENCDWGC